MKKTRFSKKRADIKKRLRANARNRLLE